MKSLVPLHIPIINSLGVILNCDYDSYDMFYNDVEHNKLETFHCLIDQSLNF